MSAPVWRNLAHRRAGDNISAKPTRHGLGTLDRVTMRCAPPSAAIPGPAALSVLLALIAVIALAGCTDPPPPDPPPYVVTSVDPGIFGSPAGSYTSAAGACSRIDLGGARQLAGPVEATKTSDDVAVPGSFSRVECEFRSAPDRPRTVYVRLTAQMYGDARPALDSYDRATKTVNTSCWKEHDSRTPISGLGARAHADQCLNPDGVPPDNLYELHVVDDNLYLEVAVHVFDRTTLPAEKAVADAGRAVAESVLSLLRRP